MNPIVDLIIRIKNGYMTRNETVLCPHSVFRVKVLEKLKQMGYIADFSTVGSGKQEIRITLHYSEGRPSLSGVTIFSTAGKRVYTSYREVKPVMSGMGCSFISTSKGILTNNELKKKKLGGELLFAVW